MPRRPATTFMHMQPISQSIVIFVHNVEDGVGDFEHAVSVAQDLQKFRDQGYKIIGIIETEKFDDTFSNTEFQKEHNRLRNKRAETVSARLKELQSSSPSLFDEAYLFDGTQKPPQWEQFQGTDEEIRQQYEDACVAYQKKHQEFIDKIKQSSLGMSVGYSTNFESNLPKNRVLNLRQYGHYSTLMGISPRHLGIKLYPERSVKDPSDKLLKIGETDYNFIANLLGNPRYTKLSADKYLKTHYLIPGYMQTFNATTTFILSEIEKQVQSKSGIIKKFDFIIPAGAIDEKRIREIIEPALARHGIKSHEILFMDATASSAALKGTEDPYAKYQVRVMSPYITKREDYESLYFLTQDGTGCSGDNTISVALSGQALPYFQFKPDALVIGRFYTEHLIPFVKAQMEAAQDPLLKEGLSNLKTYFEHLTTFTNYGQKGLFDAMNFAEPDCKYRQFNSKEEWDEIVKAQYTQQKDKIIEWCKQTGKLANANHIMDAWFHVQNELFQHYNLRDKLEDLVQLHLNQAKDLAFFIQTLRLQTLIKAGIVNPEQYSSEQLAKLIATESIVNGLCHGKITVTDVLSKQDLELLKFKDEATLQAQKNVNSSQKTLR